MLPLSSQKPRMKLSTLGTTYTSSRWMRESIWCCVAGLADEEDLNAGVDGSLWLTTANLYRDAKTSVKWSIHMSEPFKVQQGVLQGRVLSTQHYKLYNNDLCHIIVNLQTGTTIGHINCSAPTCCEDLAALARRALFLQMIMDIVEFYKNRERYGIQTTKSSSLPLHLSTESKKNSSDIYVTLDGEEIPRVSETVHLGIDRNTRSLLISRRSFSLVEGRYTHW